MSQMSPIHKNLHVGNMTSFRNVYTGWPNVVGWGPPGPPWGVSNWQENVAFHHSHCNFPEEVNHLELVIKANPKNLHSNYPTKPHSRVQEPTVVVLWQIHTNKPDCNIGKFPLTFYLVNNSPHDHSHIKVHYCGLDKYHLPIHVGRKRYWSWYRCQGDKQRFRCTTVSDNFWDIY